MDLYLIPLVFVLVLIAELPDKSMFASLVLGTKLSPRWVFLGVATAFLVHVVIAVVAGGLLSLLPKTILEIVVTVLFALGAIYLAWTSAHPDEDDEGADEVAGSGTALAAFGTSFGVVFIGEFGDITQLLTANLAAKYGQPVLVAIGAVLGLWTAAALAIVAGRTLLKYISIVWLQRVGAAILAAFAVYSLVEAITA